jgi:glucan phosphoethanolaminetransferase (alkaline phosphatase superfamily)
MAHRQTGNESRGQDMKNLFSLKHSLELAAAIVAVAALLGVLQTFIIGRHFVIPTMILVLAVLFGNLARHGQRGERWAKHVLFWIFSIATCHAFFALFWAKTPREMLGDAFLPVYGAVFVIFGFLSWQYAKKNELLK